MEPDFWYASKNPGSYVAGKKFSIDEPALTVMAAGMGGDSISHWHLYRRNPEMIWIEADNPSGWNAGKRFSIDEPSLTIMAGGMGGDRAGAWYLIDDGREGVRMSTTDKPPYSIPSMAEIRAMPWNGMKVASTFSGAGGSCTGYRMAGFRVVWANEFVPSAQESYKLNADPECYLDRRDIKLVTAEDILAQTGLAPGELDIFDGSPPCQAFSTAGKRERGWGKDKKYEHGAAQKNELLFYDYIRLLRGLQPKVFIAENVSGLIKGTAKGFFLEILADLKACGYRVEARVLDAKWLGVPQSRTRVIFIGVRNDIGIAPVFPSPLPYLYTVRDALPWILRQRIASGPFGNAKEEFVDAGNGPSPAIGTAPSFGCNINGNGGKVDAVEMIVANEKFKPKFGSTDNPSPTIMASGPCNTSGEFRVIHENGGFATTDTTDKPSPTVTATQCRMSLERVINDTGGQYSSVGDIADKASPNVKVTDQSQFRVEKLEDGRVVTRRRFTIDEVKRICSFPDDFVLAGSYAQQWERLGNSVPPLMMRAIATAVRDGVLLKARGR